MNPGQEPLKYSAVVGIGFFLDLGIAFLSSSWGGLPLELAATIGFVSALCLNYILLEFWVFPSRGKASLSINRLVATLGAATVALGARLSVIYMLGWLLDESPIQDALRLGTGFAASFIVSYILTRLIFKRHET